MTETGEVAARRLGPFVISSVGFDSSFVIRISSFIFRVPPVVEPAAVREASVAANKGGPSAS